MNGIWRAAPRINDVRERERRKNRIALNRYTHSYTHNMYLEMGINCMKTQLKHKQDAFILSFLFVRSLTFSWMLFKFSLISGTIDPNDIKWWNKPNQRANERTNETFTMNARSKSGNNSKNSSFGAYIHISAEIHRLRHGHFERRLTMNKSFSTMMDYFA